MLKIENLDYIVSKIKNKKFENLKFDRIILLEDENNKHEKNWLNDVFLNNQNIKTIFFESVKKKMFLTKIEEFEEFNFTFLESLNMNRNIKNLYLFSMEWFF